jgi:hypothetical protein
MTTSPRAAHTEQETTMTPEQLRARKAAEQESMQALSIEERMRQAEERSRSTARDILGLTPEHAEALMREGWQQAESEQRTTTTNHTNAHASNHITLVPDAEPSVPVPVSVLRRLYALTLPLELRQILQDLLPSVDINRSALIDSLIQIAEDPDEWPIARIVHALESGELPR